LQEDFSDHLEKIVCKRANITEEFFAKIQKAKFVGGIDI